MPPESSSVSPSLLARAIDTDCSYFELGARIEKLPGATLAWMPGLAATPAGAVIQRTDPTTIGAMGASWLAQAEQALADIGASTARIYFDRRDDAAEALLRGAGYAEREELVFTHSLAAPEPGLALARVESEADWDRKLDLHRFISTPPDGHPGSALDWVMLERRKCEAGMEAFLVERDGETVGAIGAIRGDGIFRLKNIVVHPAHRRQSVGLRMLGHLALVGRECGISEQCVFAVRGEIGELLYRAAGMRVAGSVIEWSKSLGAARS
jgi:ribosomal protein S18 acetylase RimI-like enzyme